MKDARKEWNAMNVKEKSVYIRKFFEETNEETLSKVDRKAFLEAKGAPVRPGSAFTLFISRNPHKFSHLSAKDKFKEAGNLWSKLDKETKDRYTKEANVELELYQQKQKQFMKSLTKEELKWIATTPKNTTKRKENDEEDETTHDDEPPQKKQKPSNALPEPEKPPEDVITFYASKKFDGDRKAAKKKWKTLKDSKKEKYQKQHEELQTTYFEELKQYLKSLSTEEVKAYKKRMKRETKEELMSE